MSSRFETPVPYTYYRIGCNILPLWTLFGILVIFGLIDPATESYPADTTKDRRASCRERV